MVIDKCFISLIGYTNGSVTDMNVLGVLSKTPTLEEVNKFVHPDRINQKQFDSLVKGEMVLPNYKIITHNFDGFMYKIFNY